MSFTLATAMRTEIAANVLAFAPNCSAGMNSASCNLNGLLHLLYVIAIVLGFILLLVVAFAIHAWRKTKEAELTRQ